ncbi:hypothetical protein MARBORIA2_06510 [Methanobrevibacter arboriphilus]|uniref:hypothetical protein n=1 Tax=Methanobrevibacter arboriphilus TaxID=39441 RepID=UPI0022ED8710|nr:hypothetical protein [Methanobrevibacter arboriphilus]GLI11561.1 hypothetical protein MARBORIA2_06510 [Methanobrevibacter arboriphilus]
MAVFKQNKDIDEHSSPDGEKWFYEINIGGYNKIIETIIKYNLGEEKLLNLNAVYTKLSLINNNIHFYNKTDNETTKSFYLDKIRTQVDKLKDDIEKERTFFISKANDIN